MKLIEVHTCSECPYRRYDDGGGFTEPWYYCTHPETHGKHIEFKDMRSGGNYNISYYAFPMWCKLGNHEALGEIK